MIVVSIAAAILLALMLLVALLNLATAPRLAGWPAPTAWPTVSLLVPARDEADNLRETLPGMLAMDYPALEVLVLDDQSRDGTAALLAGRAGDARLRVLAGTPPPPGWLGKSWACHQLARVARGDILIFCDADVAARPEAVRASVAALAGSGAGVLSALTRLRVEGWAERAVVPLVVHLPVLALLPLGLVARTAAPSLGMANGQWLVFTREAYQGCGGHAGVRGQVLEDVALARRVKAAGRRLLVVVAGPLVEVRMYRGAGEVMRGFEKNLAALAGLPAAALFLLAAVYPWVGVLLGAPGAGWALAMLAAVRLCGATLLGHGMGSLLLHPPGSLMVACIWLRSRAGARRGTLEWKGRPIAAARRQEAARPDPINGPGLGHLTGMT